MSWRNRIAASILAVALPLLLGNSAVAAGCSATYPFTPNCVLPAAGLNEAIGTSLSASAAASAAAASALSISTSKLNSDLTNFSGSTTGSGSLVLGVSPTLVAPALGVATATTINKVTITAPIGGATLTIANGKTLTASNTLTLSGTDGTVMTFPSTSKTIMATDGTGATSAALSAISSVNDVAAVMNQTKHSTFWNYPDSTLAVAKINRINDRLFVGGATVNDGNEYLHGCLGCDVPGFTELDWFDALKNLSINGATGSIGGDGNYAQVFILTDATSPLASAPAALSALTVAAQSLTSPLIATPRAINAFGINNSPNLVSVWANYDECHDISAFTANTYCFEIEARNSHGSVDPVVVWDPGYQSIATAIPIAMGCGAGLPDVGIWNCGPAMYITANPRTFYSGLLFLFGSLTSTHAIQMPYSYAVEWYKAPAGGIATVLAAKMYSDAFSNLHLDTAGGGAQLISNSSIAVPDAQSLRFGGSTGTTSIGGSTAGSYMAAVVAGTEIWRALSSGLAVGTSAMIGASKLTVNGVIAEADASSWVSPTFCGSLASATKCIVILSPNGNPMSIPAYGTY